MAATWALNTEAPTPWTRRRGLSSAAVDAPKAQRRRGNGGGEAGVEPMAEEEEDFHWEGEDGKGSKRDKDEVAYEPKE